MSKKIKDFLNKFLTPTNVFIALMSASLLLYVIIYVIIGNGQYTDIFFRNSRDFFMDFFNSIRDASNVEGVYVDRHVIYPPMANLIFLFLSRFTPDVYNSTEFGARYEWVRYSAPFMLVVVTVMLFAVILYSLVKHRLSEKNSVGAAAFALFALVNVPVLYMVERGNMLMFCVIALMIYAFSYNSENKVFREIGLLALAFAFSLKLYPVVFGWLLIADKRFKEAARCAIYGILMLILPSFAFGGFAAFKQILINITSFSSGSGNDILSYVLGYFNVEYRYGDFALIFDLITKGTILLLCLCFAVSPFVTKKKWKTYTVGLLTILSVPSLTSTYVWSFMIIPLTLLCADKEKSKSRWVYFAFMVVPFMFLPFRIHAALSISQLSFYVCLVAFSIVVIVDTIRDFIATVKENKQNGITAGQYFKNLFKVEKAN